MINIETINKRQESPQERYEKENIKKMTFKFHKVIDRDILDFLNDSGNKQGTVKKALRQLMQEEQEKAPRG